MALARSKQVPIYGLNYKDQRKDGIGWLQRYGNPYVQSAFDLEGLVGIDYGVYGVPETFVIDKFGTIRHKVIGPVSTTRVRDCVLPVVRQLEQETAPSTVALAEGFDACKT